MSVKDRLAKYISYKGLTIKAFEESIEVSNGFVNSIRKSMQPDKLERISDKYPDLNLIWMLLGRGEMLVKTEQCSIEESSSEWMNRELSKQNEHIDELLAQNRILIETLKSQTEIIKKTAALQDEDAGCAAVS